MKELNLNVQFTEDGNAILKVYCANYADKKGNLINGLKYASKEKVLKEKELYKNILDYTFICVETETIFL